MRKTLALPGEPEQFFSVAKEKTGPIQGSIPPLPPLPMKPGMAAKGHISQASGPLPAVETTPAIRYELPAITLLNGVIEQRQLHQEDVVEELAGKVEHTLRSFRVDAEVRRSDISVGPTIIRIGIRPGERVKKDYRGHVVLDDEGEPVIVRTRVSRIMALQNDLALDLEAKSIRMEAPVPGRPYVGVEIPNKNSRLVTLREILASREYEEYHRKSKLTIALGRDVAGRPRIGDLAHFPHLLIAGATGAGKSVCLNSIIACLLMQATPDDVRLLMIDPKMVELAGFNGIPHLLAPVVTEIDKVVGTLKRGTIEMERRYRLFSKLGVRNLDAYRKLRALRPELEVLPNIVIVIDELADLMMAAPEDVESLICRLAQLARATGIHLVIATQRPSVNVITGLIKANISTRISFMVSSVVDSRTILDMGGAERLLGRGDMLYMPADAGKPDRIQGTFLADEELERIVEHWRQMPALPTAPGQSWELAEDAPEESQPEDDLLAQAEQVVRDAGRASIALLQRRLGIGYARAGRLIDLLEARGIIGPADASGRARDVLSPESNSQNGSTGGSTASNRAGASMISAPSDTMLPGIPKGQVAPGNTFTKVPPVPPANPHASRHAQALPDKRNSGIMNARDEHGDTDEEVEELDW
jgi:DNA segregation ATPase FtsK/SpoIIIE-like protein